ncbi:MAG: dTDP-4-dehydrorhamnose reductase [Halocynthiibacter sp.]|jgi:dTDP-4-dehydrorhamnose reductase
MPLLIFGETGQVARELSALAPDAIALGRDTVDLSDPRACAEVIRQMTPSAVINAAAYTAVDAAEDDEQNATIINGHAPTMMARACAEIGAPLVHISTDYVLDGQGSTPFPTTAKTAPINAYGRSKEAGESGVRAAGGTYAILRTSWVFSSTGNNFLRTMLRLGATRDSLNVVADQIGGPTPARAIAEACLTIAEALKTAPEKRGIYHFSGAPDVSWADFARAIFEAANLKTKVHGIPSQDYPTPAKRPLNSRMDCSALHTAFGIERPDWRASLPALITAITSET